MIMKKIFNFLLFSFCILLFCGCEKNIDNIITMRVSPNVIMSKDTTSINLIIENHTNRDFNYGHGYSLEYFYNGDWNQVPSGSGLLRLITYELLYLQAKQQSIRLDRAYFDRPGRYRIIKDFQSHHKKYIVYAEFEVK